MRLLNVHNYQLESFIGAEEDTPQYAILSHTWGEDEITFQDITGKPLEELARRSTFYKIEQSCLRARGEDFNYICIDTCCIDKTSSAELSEAINSMFKWYQQSSVCYVYLSDFNCAQPFDYVPEREILLSSGDTSFFSCRWFTRGWTLQELIAPRKVDFLDAVWTKFGTRDGSLLDRICHRTGVWPQLFAESRCSCRMAYYPPHVRDGICIYCNQLDTLPQTLDSFAVSIKMSWASPRVTTRKEDAAYCLLGLFNINMSMLYGEGDKAFLRLQEAIARQSKDQSILLWRTPWSENIGERAPGCLAPTPANFKEPVRIVGRRVFSNINHRYEADFLGNMVPLEITDTAIRINIWVCPCTVTTLNATFEPESRQLWLGILDLAQDDDYLVRPAILLEHMGTVDLYRRVYHWLVISVDPRQVSGWYEVFQGEISHASYGPWRKNRSSITITSCLSRAFQKEIGILLQQRPIDAVRTDPSHEEGPETGPLYLMVTSNGIQYDVDSGGSHPSFSKYAARATQLPSPWAFKKCQHQGAERYFGGIHFFNFTIGSAQSTSSYPDAACQATAHRGYIAIIWGLHRRQEPDVWKSWCRVFNMNDFLRSIRTSPSLDLQESYIYLVGRAFDPAHVQRWVERQRMMLCYRCYADCQIEQATGSKALFPDSCGEQWSVDTTENILDDERFNTQVTASVTKV
ncbi:hypothetical protein FZEAL_8733 [Fusarium zealandicum]|uniref:Heterokaryon incompatibility domain-containing protein n=1 Tax=Fusarium zealandicum TaxID=1053134 RepID=A0A8H4UDW6_9HYPO|nr:hypothetical protein FZEAL_8733 [Fusarium zealandicum]